MKITELKYRESYDDMLPKTLKEAVNAAAALGWQKSEAASLRGQKSEAATQWFLYRGFDVYVTRAFSSSGRDFLYHQYAYTPRAHLRGAQHLAVSAMCTPCLSAHLLRPAFELSGCPHDAFGMWMPGNHRFRYFDFHARTVSVFPKHGFSSDLISKEVAFRKRYASQFDWLVPILNAGSGDQVFEEPLLMMYPCNREPNRDRRDQCLKRAAQCLSSLHALNAHTLGALPYLALKRRQYDEARANLAEKFPGLAFNLTDALWTQAAGIIAQLDSVKMSLTHGDFQPGNILISYQKNLPPHTAIIDWEDLDTRASLHDIMVFLLSSRAPRALPERLRAWLRNPNGAPFTLSVPPLAAVALWAIEEWIWLLSSSARRGISRLPHGLCLQFQNLPEIIDILKQ